VRRRAQARGEIADDACAAMTHARAVLVSLPLFWACAKDDGGRDTTAATLATAGTGATGEGGEASCDGSAGEGSASAEGASSAGSASSADVTGDASAEGGSIDDGAAESGGPGAMFCQLECTVASDCCPAQLPMGTTCPGDYPYDYTCNREGFCRTSGCTDDQDCTLGGMVSGYECHDVGGFPLCLIVCTSDTDCPAGGVLTCDGEADDGAMYCVGDPGAGCVDDDQCAGAGVCEDGACVCHGDGDCTIAGYGCGSW
jgi:hypothetical protein